MNLKYSTEQTEELITAYTEIDKLSVTDDEKHDLRESCILLFMGKHGHSKRSVIAKLSKLGIYVSRPKVSSVTGEKAVTKEQMLQSIADVLGVEVTKLEGLDKGPKLSLKYLRDIIDERLT